MEVYPNEMQIGLGRDRRLRLATLPERRNPKALLQTMSTRHSVPYSALTSFQENLDVLNITFNYALRSDSPSYRSAGEDRSRIGLQDSHRPLHGCFPSSHRNWRLNDQKAAPGFRQVSQKKITVNFDWLEKLCEPYEIALWVSASPPDPVHFRNARGCHP
jgi:hypothetical protein